jgi:hypothetical protein
MAPSPVQPASSNRRPLPVQLECPAGSRTAYHVVVSPKGVDVFVSDAGPEVSVRTSRDFATSAVIVEPVYASDMEDLEGATGELRAQGQTLRGRIRRHGSAFVLVQEQPPVAQVTPKPAAAPPPAAVVAPIPPAAASPVVPAAPVAPAAPATPGVVTPSAAPAPHVDTPAPPDLQVLDAAVLLSRFVRGEPGVALDAVKGAHAVIGRFISERERQAKPRK